MKGVICVLFVLLALCSGDQPIIESTKTEGDCGAYCAFEDVKIFPDQFYNQPGKCRELYCTPDFNIHITPCPPPTAEYEFVGQDDTQKYPECCGTKKLRQPTTPED